MHCEGCFCRYEYSTVARWLLPLIGAFIPTFAIVVGLYTQSWLLFAVALVLVPIVIEFVFAKYCRLRPVGLRVSKFERNL